MKRPRARAEVAPPPPLVDELERRLSALEAYIHELVAREAPVDVLRGELAKVERLASDAFERARDAQIASAIHANDHARIDTLTLAVAEGIQHVERAENRIKATIKRARQQLQEGGIESPGLEAEAHQLQLIDGGGGEGSRVLPMPSRVEESEPRPDDHQPSAVPGMSRGEFRRYGPRRAGP